MVIHNKAVVIYDIEIFPNVFHCACKDTETNEIKLFELSERKNQVYDLYNYFTDKNKLFCGYNNRHYDDVIVNYILDYLHVFESKHYSITTKSLFNLSNTIVTSEDNGIEKIKKWKYAKFFESMDLLTMMFSSKLRVGLKEMQITMHYDNVLEYSGAWNEDLPVDKIDDMISYNINDVESTYTLFHKLKDKGEIDLRLFIEKEYGINALSMDSVKFGETLLAKKVCEQMHISQKQLDTMRSPMDYIPLKDVILDIITYKNPKLQEVLTDMKKQIVPVKPPKGEKGYENRFVISNVRYSVGVGGLHSINTPGIFVPKNDEYIGHLDVASMYPSFILRYGWFPRHLGKAGLAVYEELYDGRLEAKHSGESLKNLALKLVLNSVTGKMQQETSWMYDPFSVFKIRINGQLVLLMLVDILLQHSCKIVQVNTDGVMFVAKKKSENAIMESVADLEQLTKLTFEADRYEAFYQYAVNDYFGIKDGYSQSKNPKLIEKKGMFITDTALGKGLAPVIIPTAVINYFVNGIAVEDTIKNCDDITKFIMTQRVDKKFRVEHGNKPVQRINRFYASENGMYLYKIKKLNDDTEQYNNMLTKSGVTILNKYDKKDIKDRRINYTYYTSEARKIVDNLRCVQLELFDW